MNFWPKNCFFLFRRAKNLDTVFFDYAEFKFEFKFWKFKYLPKWKNEFLRDFSIFQLLKIFNWNFYALFGRAVGASEQRVQGGPKLGGHTKSPLMSFFDLFLMTSVLWHVYKNCRSHRVLQLLYHIIISKSSKRGRKIRLKVIS